ncbi:phospholipase D-like domain-containing protein [Vibrio astriarenae]
MMRYLVLVACGLLLQACTTSRAPVDLTSADNNQTAEHYLDRRWHSADELKEDYLLLASETEIPSQPAYVKVLGVDTQSAIQSLATKIYLIDNAEHTIDLAYYIFANDYIGKSILGALCQAVERGVDVRIMVDQIGSFSLNNSHLKGLIQCAENAGYLVDRNGHQTNIKARVQAVVFNALEDTNARTNHRAHDKLFIVDGAYVEKSAVITGGRNISLDYYGINKFGEYDDSGFRDLEILVRPTEEADADSSPSQLSEYYYSILFSKPGNYFVERWITYRRDRELLLDNLNSLRKSEVFSAAYTSMPDFLVEDTYLAETKFAHELDNLSAKEVLEQYIENKQQNANSISAILAKLAYTDEEIEQIRIVSPYLFLQSELLKQQGIIESDLNTTLTWLDLNPNRTIEIVTNSVLTSDNPFTQSIIDMQTAPTMLLDESSRKSWIEDNPEARKAAMNLLTSEAWLEAIAHPRIHFYQLGKLDSNQLDGEVEYGMLHAKFLIFDDYAFVGTTNLDYRSFLFNNEIGFFLSGEDVTQDLSREFDKLKQNSLRWGTPEWLEMRKAVKDKGGKKGLTTRYQRSIWGFLESTGLKYQF